jgi:ABC-2 type transport system permease protein
MADKQLPLILLRGVAPLSLDPTWLQGIAHVNPMYYTVEASRVLATGVLDSSEILAAFAVMVPLTDGGSGGPTAITCTAWLTSLLD